MHALNPQRVWLLLQRQALLRGRGNLVGLGLPLLVLIATAFFNSSDGPGEGSPFFAVWYGFFLLLGGYFAVCKVLKEHATADGRQSSLTLPASDTEKWLAAYLWSGPITLVAVTVIFWLATLLANGLVTAAGYPPHTPFNPFAESTWWVVSAYLLLIQPVAFLGAIAFDTKVAAKTAAAISIVVVALGLIASLTFRIVFHEAFDGFASMTRPVEFADGNPFAVDPVWGLGHVPEVLFALLLLTAAYFRFHEKEV